MKQLFVAALILAFVAAPFVIAEGEAAPAAPAKDKPELEEITLAGTLTSEEDTNAKGEKVLKFVVTDPDGNLVKLPKMKDKADGKPEINLAALVGKNVTVAGKGTKKDGKVQLKKIISVTEVVAEEGGDAPAAQ